MRVEHTTPGPRLAVVVAGVTLIAGAVFGLDVLPHLRSVLFAPVTTHEQVDMAGKVLADFSRVLGVSLSMLVALCALAIPLTANVWSPKLIEIFLADRWNVAEIGYLLLANGVVLWSKFMLAGQDPQGVRLRVFVCLVLTLAGVSSIGPYLLYVLRFLVPRGIVRRLERATLEGLVEARGARREEDLLHALEAAVNNVQYLGKITLRSIERYDRDTAYEGLRALESVFERYQDAKATLPAGFFQPDGSELLGLTPELGREVVRRRATLEVAVLQELDLLLPLAIQRLPEVVSRVAALARRVGARAAERGEEGPLEMVLLHFNTFLRRSLQARSPDAFYKFVYQYRRLAEELLPLAAPQAQRVAFFLDYYGHQGERMGLPFLLNVVAYDLAALCDAASLSGSPALDELLSVLTHLDRDRPPLADMPGVVKAQLILAARLRARGAGGVAARLVQELRTVPLPRLREAFSQIAATREEEFWEIGDRRRHLDHVEPEVRPFLGALREELLRDVPAGEQTRRYLRLDAPQAAAPAALAPRPPGAAGAGQPAVPSLQGRGKRG